MTISDIPSVETKLGNDVTTVFSFAFVINRAADLSVLITDSDGVETPITEGIGVNNYSISVADYPGNGSITYPATLGTELPTGSTITMARVVDLDQDTDLINQGAWNPDQVESTFDYSRMVDQQQQDEIDRSLKVPISDDSGADYEIPAMGAGVADKLLGAASDGLSFVWQTVASLGAVVISNLTPLVAGTGDAGTSEEISRADHVHPSAKDVIEILTNKTLNDDTNFIHANGIHQACRNVSGGDYTSLTPVYNAGWNAGQGTIEILKADANGIGTVPALGILDAPILNNTNGDVLTNGTISNIDASGTPVGEVWADMDTLYVSETAGELTNVRPTAADASVQAIAQVLRAHAVNGVIFVQGAGRVNDVPNLIDTKAQVQETKGADVASAAALPILTDGNYFDVTGANAITSINTTGKVGTVIKLHFDAALTLTHHATDLILPGGANITTAAGDEAEFVEYASGDFRCTNYQVATVTPGSGSGFWVPKLAIEAAGDAFLEFEHIAGKDYRYEFEQIFGSVDGGQYLAELGVAGPTYRTSLYDGLYTRINDTGASSSGGIITANIPIVQGTTVGNATDEGFRKGHLELLAPAEASIKTAYDGTSTLHDLGTNLNNISFGGTYTVAEAQTFIKFYSTAGNTATGIIRQFERARS